MMVVNIITTNYNDYYKNSLCCFPMDIKIANCYLSAFKTIFFLLCLIYKLYIISIVYYKFFH